MARFAGLKIFAICVFVMPDAAGSSPVDPLFESDEILAVSITAPLTKIVQERSTKDYEPGTLLLSNNDGSTTGFDIKIRARGFFRRENCYYPPVWLNFKKSQVRGTVFENQDKIKIVLHCENSDLFEQSLLREYLAYRVLNLLTDNSFRVRLLRVTYTDIDDSTELPPRYAFLIEHKKRLAARLDRKLLDVDSTSFSDLDPGLLNLTSVFQFFVGNTDFSPIAAAAGQSCCHNYVLLGDRNKPVLPVPYDFDQSGFVNAPYAIPNPALGIVDVRARLYRGVCINNTHLPSSLQRFKEQREAIYALIADQADLESRTRRSLIRYTDSFFKIIDDPMAVQRRLEQKCR